MRHPSSTRLNPRLLYRDPTSAKNLEIGSTEEERNDTKEEQGKLVRFQRLDDETGQPTFLIEIIIGRQRNRMASQD